VRTIGEQAPPVRCLGLRDGVVIDLVAVAPAVEDQEKYGFGLGHSDFRQ
jgi:hypothetical protein